MVNFSSFYVRYLCVASVIIINLDSSGSVKDDMIAHARLQTARTKRLGILNRSSHLNSAQMTSSAWNVWSETVSLATAGQSFETADVVVGRHIMICYAYFFVAEIHDTAVHRVVVQGSDVYLQDGHPLWNREFSFRDDAVLSDAFSPFDDSSLLTTQHPFLYAFLPACQHSFLSANLLFLLLPITICRIMYGIFLQSKKQVTSISDDDDKDSAGSEASSKEITEMAEKSSENKSELLLDLDSPLSRGKSNSVVYKGTLRQRPVAVKVSYRAGSYRQASREPSEVKHVKHLRHPHVVKVRMSLSNTPFKIRLNSSQAPTGQTDMSYETLIVMEYCDRGSLHNALKYRLLSVPEKHQHITTCALEIAQAMDHIHSKRIIHGALHAKHIFLQSDIADPRGFKCKVGGFGSCLRLSHGSASVHFSRNQHVTRAAPETIRDGLLCYASDVYDFGCLLYTMCLNRTPFSGHKRNEIPRLIVAGRRPAIPSSVPPLLARLITECWSQCPRERPSFSSIVQKLNACVQLQERCIPAHRGTPLRRYPSVPVEALSNCACDSLIPGKRYAYIDFQPFEEKEQRTMAIPTSDLGQRANKEKEHVTARRPVLGIDLMTASPMDAFAVSRTKSCSLTLERNDSMSKKSNAVFVRQVDDLIKRSRRSESKAELKQFLKTRMQGEIKLFATAETDNRPVDHIILP